MALVVQALVPEKDGAQGIGMSWFSGVGGTITWKVHLMAVLDHLDVILVCVVCITLYINQKTSDLLRFPNE